MTKAVSPNIAALMAKLKAEKAAKELVSNPKASKETEIKRTFGKLDEVKEGASSEFNSDSNPQPSSGKELSELSTTAELPEAKLVKERIQRLRISLQNSIPDYDSILHTIHRQLSKDTELTHLLSESEIGTIVAAMCKKKGVILTAELLKSASKKSMKNTTVDDL